MSIDDQIGEINVLAEAWEATSVPFKTTEELREFFSNPKKYISSLGTPLEEAIDRMVELFPGLSMAERASASSILNRAAKNALLRYAGTLSMRATDQRAPNFVNKALVALAVEGGSLDIRDSIGLLRGLRDSATALGLDVPTEFSAASKLMPHDAPLQLGTNLHQEIGKYI